MSPDRLTTVALLVAAVALMGCGDDSATAADTLPDGVVGLAVSGCGTGKAHGTGTLVGPGLVLTSAHVVKGADEVVVSTEAGDVTGTIVGFDPNMDLAYVDAEVQGARPATVGGLVDAGDEGVAYVVRRGQTETIAVTIRRPIRIHTEDIYVQGDTYRPGFEIEADVESGDSGGPVVIDGRVVGVLWSRSNQHPGRAYAIDPVAGGELINRQLDDGISSEIDLTRCI